MRRCACAVWFVAGPNTLRQRSRRKKNDMGTRRGITYQPCKEGNINAMLNVCVEVFPPTHLAPCRSKWLRQLCPVLDLHDGQCVLPRCFVLAVAIAISLVRFIMSIHVVPRELVELTWPPASVPHPLKCMSLSRAQTRHHSIVSRKAHNRCPSPEATESRRTYSKA